MNVVSLNKKEIDDVIKSSAILTGASKYPWATTQVGDGFFVPRSKTAREDYRPPCPIKLKEAGQKWISKKVTFKNNVGVLCIRVK